MNKTVLLFSVFIIAARTDPDPLWFKFYGSKLSDGLAYDLLPLPGGDVVIVFGERNCCDTLPGQSFGEYNLSVERVDTAGSSVWYQSFGEESIRTFVNAGVTETGEIFVSGLGPQGMLRLLWISDKGPIQKTLDVPNVTFNGAGVVRYGGNGNALGFSTLRLTPASDSLATLFIIDSTGSVSWSRTYPSGLIREAKMALSHSSGGYFLLGGTESDGTIALLTDSLGDTLWTRENRFQIDFNDLIELSNGDVISAGSVYDSDLGSLSVGRISSVLQYHYFDNRDWWTGHWDVYVEDEGMGYYLENEFYGMSVTPTLDSGYVMTGSSQIRKLSTYRRGFIYRTNHLGGKMWSDGDIHSRVNRAYRTLQLADGGYLALGNGRDTTLQIGGTSYSIQNPVLIKYGKDSELLSVRKKGASQKLHDIIISRNSLKQFVQAIPLESGSLQLFNISGEKIFEHAFYSQEGLKAALSGMADGGPEVIPFLIKGSKNTFRGKIFWLR